MYSIATYNLKLIIDWELPATHGIQIWVCHHPFIGVTSRTKFQIFVETNFDANISILLHKTISSLTVYCFLLWVSITSLILLNIFDMCRFLRWVGITSSTVENLGMPKSMNPLFSVISIILPIGYQRLYHNKGVAPLPTSILAKVFPSSLYLSRFLHNHYLKYVDSPTVLKEPFRIK